MSKKLKINTLPELNGIALLSYYNTPPESPDGKHLAYTLLPSLPSSRTTRQDGELWISDRNGNDKRKVADFSNCATHNGANVLWLNNHQIAFLKDIDMIQVVDIENGNLLDAPLAGDLGHNTHNGSILATLNNPVSNDSEVWEYNIKEGTSRLIIKISTIRSLLPETTPEWVDPPEKWTCCHAQYSKDGSHIAIRVSTTTKEKMKSMGLPVEWRNLLVTFKSDGSDHILFGPKPMHFLWYDADTIIGHDSQVDDGLPNDNKMRCWDRYGNVISTLAGSGCHGAFSADNKWIASETWYGSNPIILKLYRLGKPESGFEIFRTKEADKVWSRAIHLNPSFSPDSKRLYFNHPLENNRTTIAWVDLPTTSNSPV